MKISLEGSELNRLVGFFQNLTIRPLKVELTDNHVDFWYQSKISISSRIRTLRINFKVEK